MAGTFVRLILLAGGASVSAGYAVCFLLRKLGPQAARVEEWWFWLVAYVRFSQKNFPCQA